MKKFIVIVLALAMVLSLGACDNAPAQSSAPAASSSVAAPSTSASSAAPSESASAAPSGTFTIGLECGYPPYNWTQTDDSKGAVAIDGGGGYAGGYDIEMAKLIAASLNKTLVVKKIEWNGLVPACQSGVIDAIIAGMSPTAERKEAINFTDTYCAVSVGVVVKKGGKFENAASLADFADAKISAQLNTFHYGLIDQLTGAKKQTAMDDFPAMRLALQSGIIDGYVSEKPEGISAQNANKDFKFIEFAEGKGFTTSSDDTMLAIGINKSAAELLSGVNKALAAITDAQRTTLMDNAIVNQPASN
jgi:putative lysine transport system substrate-binding protein